MAQQFPGQDPNNRGGLDNTAKLAILGVGVAIVVLGTSIGGNNETAPTASEARPAKLTSEVVVQCRDLLRLGQREGIIRARPDPNRINVEDALWAQLPAETKDRTLQAMACDLWQTAMPPEGQYVVAYGYRSGKRLQMLTEVGMSRE